MWAFLLAAAVGPTATVGSPAAEPDFNRDVRPILARHCFKCHGPDEKIRKGKLRLGPAPKRRRRGALAARPSCRASLRRAKLSAG